MAASDAPEPDRKYSVVATTGMIADAARHMGGDLVHVTALMKPGVDPHLYRQTRSDISALASADLVLWNGLYLEAQMEDFLRNLSAKRRVVAVAESIPAASLITHEDYENKHDPHLWMDPVLWKAVVFNVAAAMMDAFPEARGTIRENADRYMSRLDDLAAYSSSALGSVPEQGRVLLTAHDAFGYFGRAYGFEVFGIRGISTESEPGLHRIRELVDLIIDRQIGAIFVESSVPERNVKALVEGAAARGHSVRIGGELFSDSMGEENTYEGTYIGMIDHNTTLIAQALGGTPPLAGMQGKLRSFADASEDRE